jgi:hypothetical protein
VSRERGGKWASSSSTRCSAAVRRRTAQRLRGTLHPLSERSHQLLLITHAPEIAELCEHQLVVDLVEPGSSRATITS